MPTDSKRCFIRYGLEGSFRLVVEDDNTRIRSGCCYVVVLASSPEEAERKNRELEALRSP